MVRKPTLLHKIVIFVPKYQKQMGVKDEFLTCKVEQCSGCGVSPHNILGYPSLFIVFFITLVFPKKNKLPDYEEKIA